MELQVENLIYLYMVICVTLIVFNFTCIFVFRLYKSRIAKKSVEFVRDGDSSSIQLTENGLLALEQSIDELIISDSIEAESLCRKFSQIAYDGIVEDKIKDPIIVAYVLHLAVKYDLFVGETSQELKDKIIRFACDNNFYLRQNALELLYSIGDADALIFVLHHLDYVAIYHNDKLLHDGMMNYSGDKEALWDRIWSEFDAFSPYYQVMFLKYFSFETGMYQQKMFDLLRDESRDSEVRFACLRYLKKYPYEKARRYIYEMLSNRTKYVKEYSVIGANTLAAYPGEETLELLKELLADRNWYVRHNAAESLISLNADKEDIYSILDGDDRYAREALQYVIDRRSLNTEGVRQ